MPVPGEQFLGIEEVAVRLQVSDQTIRRWIKSGKLSAYKPGREWRISPDDLEEFLKSYSYPKVQAPLPSPPEETAGEERREKDEGLAVALMMALAEQGEDLEEALKVSFSEGLPLGWAYAYGNQYLALRLVYEMLNRGRPVQRETREAWEVLEKTFSRVNKLVAPHLGDASAGDMRALAAFSKNRAENRRLRESDDEASDINDADVS